MGSVGRALVTATLADEQVQLDDVSTGVPMAT